ncbi:MAG: tetratricopeptide repeat protein [Phenylobacterium sp.]
MIDAPKPVAAGKARGAVTDLMGSSASAAALRVLRGELTHQRNARIAGLLDRALIDIKAHRPKGAAALALEALQLDEKCGIAWHVLAIAQEGLGDFVTSLSCYEAALALLPDDPEVLINLGRLAFRMGMHNTAEKLFRHFLARAPDHPEGMNNLALAIGAQNRSAEAIEALRGFIALHPTHANLWNSLGGLVSEEGDIKNAEIFYKEALRLNPRIGRVRYNLGSMWLDTGETEAALKEVEGALKRTLPAHEKAMMTMTRGLAQIALGRIAEGWRNYEARIDLNFPDSTYFAIQAEPWKPGQDIVGRSLLLVGEQGLGDEVLFGSIIPDVVEALGPEGRLSLAVEPRLVPLFARSFPNARVETHKTVSAAGRTVRLVPALEGKDAGIEYWAAIASLLQQYRPRLEDFPQRTGYLKPDPERVDHWRKALSSAPPGPKVGLLWKSAVLSKGRQRFFSPFEAWEPVLRTPGVVFVNLQYGDCDDELQLARERYGVEIWSPPGIDLRQDLDDVTALSAALDLVVGFSNATFNLAAAAGAPAWLIASKGAWTPLGTDRYPWYPQVRLYPARAYAVWEPVLLEIAKDLAAEFGTSGARRAPPDAAEE